MNYLVLLWIVRARRCWLFYIELAGECKLDQARADMTVDCIDDATRPFLHPGYVMNRDEDAKV